MNATCTEHETLWVLDVHWAGALGAEGSSHQRGFPRPGQVSRTPSEVKAAA